MLLGDRQFIVLKRKDVALDRLADILDGLLPGLSLRDASGKTRTLDNPKTVLARIHNDLSHIHKATRLWRPVKGQFGCA